MAKGRKWLPHPPKNRVNPVACPTNRPRFSNYDLAVDSIRYGSGLISVPLEPEFCTSCNGFHTKDKT